MQWTQGTNIWSQDNVIHTFCRSTPVALLILLVRCHFCINTLVIGGEGGSLVLTGESNPFYKMQMSSGAFLEKIEGKPGMSLKHRGKHLQSDPWRPFSSLWLPHLYTPSTEGALINQVPQEPRCLHSSLPLLVIFFPEPWSILALSPTLGNTNINI